MLLFWVLRNPCKFLSSANFYFKRNVRQTRDLTRFSRPGLRGRDHSFCLLDILIEIIASLKSSTNLLQPIGGTTQIWVMTQHQYGISTVVPQASFCGETSGSVLKCRMFSTTSTDYFPCSSFKSNTHTFSGLSILQKKATTF